MKDLHGGITNCLLVQTKFSDYSFWNYQDVCRIVGRKYPAAPLGLLTVAALFPQHWNFRLIDENVEPLKDQDMTWADLVCIGGMLPQQASMLKLISRAKALGCTVVVGGPDPTHQPDLYSEADFLVLGEGEITIPLFLADLKKGIKTGRYISENKANMFEAAVPRYDLINFGDYIMIGLQFIRGCPFNCEFCDVIELYGRTPRFKTNEQVIRELQSLYDLGYRGHIDMVDDNFIGNKKKVKALLHEMIAWSKARKYPFYFTTEASVNLADDDELLQLMKDADFRYVFLGIETPDNETLAQNNKTQNVNKSINDAVLKILSYGMVSNGGYIIGFDTDRKQIASQMIDSIQDSGICMAMIGLLYALPNTQLTRRLETEGRLFHLTSRSLSSGDIDQMTSGLNFITLTPRTEILRNYIRVIESIFKPSKYYERIIYTSLKIRPKYKHKPDFKTWLLYMRSFLRVCKKAGFSKATGFLYWKMFFTVILRNPMGIEAGVNLAAMFIHFQKQKEYIVSVTGDLISLIEKEGVDSYNRRMMGKSS
ncbi:MAG: B12-binding domain-containing radical SAM protein [Bacteroidetes bacterium]|nr:B12-binding domain-containing radical SAM protein [Bacteroidota bacterium]